MITRRRWRRTRRTLNRLRGQVQAQYMALRSYGGNPLKPAERVVLQKRMESLQGTTDEKLAESCRIIDGLYERIKVLEKVPRLVRWIFGAVWKEENHGSEEEVPEAEAPEAEEAQGRHAGAAGGPA
jgi:hypothetical protein